MKALGMIETRGLVAAIESADVMLKAAQVQLQEKTLVGGGLVTVTVAGDVGAVQAAVEAGASAAELLSKNCLISRHVIPRPHAELALLMPQQPAPGDSQPPAQQTAGEEETPPREAAEDATEPKAAASGEEAANRAAGRPTASEASPAVPAALPHPPKQEKSVEDVEDAPLEQINKENINAVFEKAGLERTLAVLQGISVPKLRRLAREYPLGIAGRAVSRANKSELLQQFQNYYEAQ